MSYEFYKVLHLAAAMYLFASLGGMALHAMNGGTRADNPSHRVLVITHGVSLLVLLVAGFGAVAKLGVPMGGWVAAKVVIWLALGGAIAVAGRRPEAGKALFFALPLLGAVAGWLAVTKPF